MSDIKNQDLEFDIEEVEQVIAPAIDLDEDFAARPSRRNCDTCNCGGWDMLN
jgi:hypothetical protein